MDLFNATNYTLITSIEFEFLKAPDKIQSKGLLCAAKCRFSKSFATILLSLSNNHAFTLFIQHLHVPLTLSLYYMQCCATGNYFSSDGFSSIWVYLIHTNPFDSQDAPYQWGVTAHCTSQVHFRSTAGNQIGGWVDARQRTPNTPNSEPCQRDLLLTFLLCVFIFLTLQSACRSNQSPDLCRYKQYDLRLSFSKLVGLCVSKEPSSASPPKQENNTSKPFLFWVLSSSSSGIFVAKAALLNN